MRSLVKPTQILLIVSAMSLVACGGSNEGSGSLIGNPPSNGGGNGGTPGDAPGGGDNTTVRLALGSGDGNSFQAGALTLGASSISANGQVIVSANVVNQANGNSLYTTSPVSINFTSNCAEQGLATISSPIITSTGTAQTTYIAKGCSGSDTITARLGDSSASANLIIASAAAGSLTFSSATPTSIAIKNLASAGLTTVSEVQFIVRDDANNPLQGETVKFTLSDTTGGITLTNPSDKTDASGIARAFVNAGTVKTTVRVNAQLESNPLLQTTSNTIAIGTGVPSAETLTFTATEWNMPACSDFNYTNSINIRVSDFYRNPIPAGTKIIFYTSHGQIDPECSYDPAVGGCSATWRPAQPYPWDNDGRLSVMAMLKGEEAAPVDLNGNHLFDSDEQYEPLPEAYLDENTNGQYDLGELFIDWDGNQSWSDTPAANKYGSTKFRGVRCSADAREDGHCQGLADIFIQRTLQVSCPVPSDGSTITFSDRNCSDNSWTETETTSGSNNKTLYICVRDEFGGAPAAGTRIEVKVESGDATIVGGNISSITESNLIGPQVIPVTITPKTLPSQSKLTVLVTNVEGSTTPVPKSLTINHQP